MPKLVGEFIKKWSHTLPYIKWKIIFSPRMKLYDFWSCSLNLTSFESIKQSGLLLQSIKIRGKELKYSFKFICSTLHVDKTSFRDAHSVLNWNGCVSLHWIFCIFDQTEIKGVPMVQSFSERMSICATIVLEHSDWLFKRFQPIRGLKNTEKFFTGSGHDIALVKIAI